MKTSEVAFKVFGTCLVLCIPLTIMGWCKIGIFIWALDVICAVMGGVALIIAIIALIWDQ